MKRLLISLIGVVGLSTIASAGIPATSNTSSVTYTSGAGYIPASYIDVVIIGSASTNGSLGLYNSTFTSTPSSVTAIVSTISLSNVGTYHFYNRQVKGLWVITTGNTNGVTIIYKK